MKLTKKQSILLDSIVDKSLDLILIESEYHDYFKQMLKKYGVSSPNSLSPEDKKKFFSAVKSGWQRKKNRI
jgi:hypothetical protein